MFTVIRTNIKCFHVNIKRRHKYWKLHIFFPILSAASIWITNIVYSSTLDFKCRLLLNIQYSILSPSSLRNIHCCLASERFYDSKDLCWAMGKFCYGLNINLEVSGSDAFFLLVDMGKIVHNFSKPPQCL